MNPTGRFWLLLFAASAPVVLTTVLEVPLIITVLPAWVVLMFALADRFLGTKLGLKISRKVGTVLSVGVSNPVSVSVRNLGGLKLDIELADEIPHFGTAKPQDAKVKITLHPYKTTNVKYGFTPERRGRFSFDGTQICHRSRLGMWYVTRRFEVKSKVDVYPNIEALHRFELLARVNSLDEMGVRTVRMKGEGTEFERLRDYRPGDEPRKVNWKASRRFGKLIVREMGQERNQNILLLIDMGRMMKQTTDGLSHFDYALNTAIILAHIAQSKGDNVGAVFFSDKVNRYVPLGRGRATVDAIVRAGYDVEPEPVATNYAKLFGHVTSQVRKRSMLLLLTHLVPGEDRRLIRSYMKMLGRKHLPLCLFFREPALEQEVDKIPATVGGAFERAAAADILLERNESIAALRHAGVMAMDAFPGELSVVAIGNYLDVKARNLL